MSISLPHFWPCHWRLADRRVVSLTSLGDDLPDLVYADRRWDWVTLTDAEWKGAKAVTGAQSKRLSADAKQRIIPAPP